MIYKCNKICLPQSSGRVVAVSIASCLVAGSLKTSLKPCCCASLARPVPGQLGACCSHLPLRREQQCPAEPAPVHPQLGFREAVHGLAWLKRELPGTSQGVGAFLVMVSGWEWGRRRWCGLPVPRWCWELPVQAALLPSPKAWLSPCCSGASGNGAAESCSLPRHSPAKIPLASHLELCDQPSPGTGDG